MKVIQTIFFIGLWIPVAQAKLRGVSDRGQDRFLAIRRTAMMATGGTSSGGAVATEVAIVGGVTTSSAVVGFRTDQSASVKIVYAANARFRGHTFSSSYTTLADDDFTGSILLNGLQPSQNYWYRITVDGVEQNPGSVQKFETFPAAGSTFRFSIFADAAPYYNNNAANAYSAGSSNPNEDDALFAMQIGDFDHSDPQDIAAVRLMHRGLRDINSAGGVDFADNILTKMSFVHVYDDHDYCGNDSDGTCAHKADVLKAYDEYYPGYTRPNPTDGIYHSFVAGDAEIFMLDTRYQRTPNAAVDNSAKTMLGATQKQWLKDSLTSSTAAWKIIISTVSANKHARPNNQDHWGSFKTEAHEMKEFIAANPNLALSTVMVSGDLHTGGGLDGGCNGRWDIPELSVAHTNLNNGNTMAVGFWSEGIRDGSHKGYGSIVVSPTTLTLESKGVTGNAINTLTLPGPYNTDGCVTAGAGIRQCSSNFFPLNLPTSGDCADIDQFQTYTPPFINADGPEPIENDVKWFDCEISGLVIMRSNDIPDHTVTINNPNKPCVQNIHAEFPRTPSINAAGKTETDNILGFAVNGVVAFSPLEAGNNNAVEPLPGATLLDAQHWYGHPTAEHVWHYHSPFLGNDEETTSLASTTLLGVAMDGYPIFGAISNPDLVLDECNFDAATNRYHIRTKYQVDETLDYCDGTNEAVNWKYIIGCYRGELGSSAIKDSLVETIPVDCVEVPFVEDLFN